MTHPTDALRLVPVEPNHQMHYDGDRALANAVRNGGSIFDTTKAIWSAMLAAAPASPLPEGGGQCSGITGELSGWQDISTAPKDGTPLLAGSIHHSDREVVCWQDGLPSGSMDTDAAWEGWVNDGPQKDRLYVNPRYFTHFMPLPAAPTGAK